MKKIDFVLVGNHEKIQRKAEAICQIRNFTFQHEISLDSLMDQSELYEKVGFMLVVATGVENQQEIAGMLQVARQVSQTAYCAVCINNKIPPEQLQFIKKSGANLVILDIEIETTCKMEFVATQVLKAAYLPIKKNEIVADIPVPLNLYHIMPLNKKFLPVVRKGEIFDHKKIEQLGVVSELYVKREELELWIKYIQDNQDKSSQGAAGRCRAQFLNLSTVFFDLVLIISDQSEYNSFDKGRQLYQKCYDLASDLLTNLAVSGEAWDIINQSAVFAFGPIERSPAIASYAGLAALKANIDNPVEIMIAALLMDLGLLECNQKTLQAINTPEFSQIHQEDQNSYFNHPIVSLNKALSRKLPLPERVQNIIAKTHERSNGRGFPKKVPAEKVPAEAFLVQFCEILDLNSQIKLGKERTKFVLEQTKLFQQELENADRIPGHLLLSWKPHFES